MDPIDMNNEDLHVRYPPLISDENAGPSPDSSPLNVGANNPLRNPLPLPRSNGGMIENIDRPKEPRLRKRHHPSTSALLVTNERLAHQTALARTLQAQSEDVFSVLKNTYQNNLSLQAHLTKVQSELSLYKHQLQLAESEIRRAEEIVKDVDKLRVEAEERSMRDRAKLRKLMEERAVLIAKEEGRREGFQLGLEQGRRMVWALHANDSPKGSVVEEEEYESTSGRSRADVSTTRSRRPSMTSYARSSSPPQGREFAQNRSRMSESVRQRQRRIPSVVPNQHPIFPSEETRKSPLSERSRHTSTYAESRRTLAQNRPPPSPSFSHRSVPVPPEGYIPTKTNVPGQEGYIRLPPPHELGIPITAAEDEDSRSTRSALNRRHGRAVTPKRTQSRTRSISSASGASTRISEYDLVSPPRGAEIRDSRFTPSLNNLRSPSQKKVEEWRRNSAEVVSPQPRRTFTIVNASPADHIGEESLGESSRHTGSRLPPTQIPSDPPLGESSSLNRMTASRSGSRTRIPSDPPLGESSSLNRMTAPRNGSRTQIPSDPPLGESSLNRMTASRSGESRTQMLSDPPIPGNQSVTGSPTSPPIVQLQEGSTQRKTPLEWLRSRFQRSHSSPQGVTNIQIEVEPPSASQSSSNSGTIIDPVLLTPEHANRSLTPGDKPPTQVTEPITIVLPDDNLPPGFVPQSPMMPIPGTTNIVAMSASVPGPSVLERSNPVRPATAGGGRVGSPHPSFMSRSLTSFGQYMSPAPLNRPISLFSED